MMGAANVSPATPDRASTACSAGSVRSTGAEMAPRPGVELCVCAPPQGLILLDSDTVKRSTSWRLRFRGAMAKSPGSISQKIGLYFLSSPEELLPAPTPSISGSIFSDGARVWPVAAGDGALVFGLAAGGRSVLPDFEVSAAAGGLLVRLDASGRSCDGTCADAQLALARSTPAKRKRCFIVVSVN